MYKVIEYVVSDVMIVINLSLKLCNSYQFYYHFYMYIESKIPYPLTSSTHLPTSFSSSSGGSIITPTPNITQGKYTL